MEERQEAVLQAEELGIIVFRAFNRNRQQPVVATPLEDMTGRLWTGQGPTGYYEDLTPEDKAKLSVVFDHRSKYVVLEGKSLDIKNKPFDAAQWKWIQKHPYIAMSKEEKTPDSVYYVDNPKLQAEKVISRDKKITKVKTQLYNASTDKKKIVAKALGLFGADGLTDSQLEEWLVGRIEESPDTVSNLLDPKNASMAKGLVLVKEMLTYKVIKRYNTVYKYGGTDGITLGRTEEEVAEWIADSNNEDTVLIMSQEINERKGL